MTIRTFQELYDSFCAATGTAPQELEEDDEGCAAFSAELRGVTVNVMHTVDSHPDSAFVLVDFGPPPEEQEAEAFRRLLMTNFTMLGQEPASAFSIHPVYGNVMLQATYPFEQHSGEHLLRSLRALAELALRWRETHFLEEASADGERR
ncbi:MAG TPA: CesT family type III secretion system chaperone [Ramlibacter sp.]|uniref:CesT family type III secretion system chaperone n=1 Tax=Ramlibacter sp. TaxID=1917967 RepID=UPI002D183DFF|nr:CesT family type III secretion system chaperone [Ramlibacter sp.]HVZ44306.1 CesT family type III secretion system chaperone [Ramlibacter sp.]